MKRLEQAGWWIDLELFKLRHPTTADEIVQSYIKTGIARLAANKSTIETCEEFAKRLLATLKERTPRAREYRTLQDIASETPAEIAQLVEEYTDERAAKELRGNLNVHAISRDQFWLHDINMTQMIEELESIEPTAILAKFSSYGDFTEEFASALFGNLHNTQYAAKNLVELIRMTDGRQYGTYRYKGEERKYSEFKVTDFLRYKGMWKGDVIFNYNDMVRNLLRKKLTRTNLPLKEKDGPYTADTKQIAKDGQITLELAYDLRKIYSEGHRYNTGIELLHASGQVDSFFDKHITLPEIMEDKEKELEHIRRRMHENIKMMQAIRILLEQGKDTSEFYD